MKVQCFLYNTEATEPDIVIPAGRKELTGFDTREEKDQKKKKTQRWGAADRHQYLYFNGGAV